MLRRMLGKSRKAITINHSFDNDDFICTSFKIGYDVYIDEVLVYSSSQEVETTSITLSVNIGQVIRFDLRSTYLGTVQIDNQIPIKITSSNYNTILPISVVYDGKIKVINFISMRQKGGVCP